LRRTHNGGFFHSSYCTLLGFFSPLRNKILPISLRTNPARQPTSSTATTTTTPPPLPLSPLPPQVVRNPARTLALARQRGGLHMRPGCGKTRHPRTCAVPADSRTSGEARVSNCPAGSHSKRSGLQWRWLNQPPLETVFPIWSRLAQKNGYRGAKNGGTPRVRTSGRQSARPSTPPRRRKLLLPSPKTPHQQMKGNAQIPPCDQAIQRLDTPDAFSIAEEDVSHPLFSAFDAEPIRSSCNA
jgi:hypothetical protein